MDASGREVLASDGERDAIVQRIQEAHVEGRLTTEEFGDRLTQATVARTRGDLADLVADLPAAVPVPVPVQPPAEVVPAAKDDGLAGAWRVWAGVNAVVFVIWLTTFLGTGGEASNPWFLWVAGPWGGALLLATITKSGKRHG
jgi:hypothetical protein